MIERKLCVQVREKEREREREKERRKERRGKVSKTYFQNARVILPLDGWFRVAD